MSMVYLSEEQFEELKKYAIDKLKEEKRNSMASRKLNKLFDTYRPRFEHIRKGYCIFDHIRSTTCFLMGYRYIRQIPDEESDKAVEVATALLEKALEAFRGKGNE